MTDSLDCMFFSLPKPAPLTEVTSCREHQTLYFERDGFKGKVLIQVHRWQPGQTDVVNHEMPEWYYLRQQNPRASKDDNFLEFFRHCILFPNDADDAAGVPVQDGELDGLPSYFASWMTPDGGYKIGAAIDLGPRHYFTFLAGYEEVDDDSDEAGQEAAHALYYWIVEILNSVQIKKQAVAQDSKEIEEYEARVKQEMEAFAAALPALVEKVEQRDYANQTHAERIFSFLCLTHPGGIEGAVEITRDGRNFPNDDADWWEWISEQEDISCAIEGLMYHASTDSDDRDEIYEGCQQAEFLLRTMMEARGGNLGELSDDDAFDALVADAKGVEEVLSFAAREIRKHGFTLWVGVDKNFETQDYFGWITRSEDEAAMHALSRILCDGTVQRYEDTRAYKA